MRPDLDLSHAEWVKSSYSNGNEGQCVEFAPGIAAATGVIPVRDSKRPAGLPLFFSVEAWDSFAAAVRTGKFLTR
ncbi:DUF397 domain-containing protein [Streptomyces sp. AgN23]|uniref:DUF397 domain-containing protein n=1 Tax=Streptomyces TaxID=1883 RepID=UPI001B324DAB|nr:DUF397 domain-containing protein [Streptomyces sp. AgN23]QTI89380.1 DUF397 domain-containing protein [Streptomyces sp. AgN23]WTB05356.1 DUF397 domain-containing protein [Streptomyces antimycoticus]